MKLLDLQDSPAEFRRSLLIDTDNGPRPFAECLDPWQANDFTALDSGWRLAAKQRVEGGYQRAWLERPRGHSKTLDLAVMASWILFASRRRLSGVAAAGDQDQARLLRDAMGKLLHLNPWLARILEVQSYRVLNTHTESTLEIISSDAPTSYGLTPDFEVLDEVVHWRNRDLWDSLISSAAKRASCMVVVITNAGMLADWQWQAREAIRADSNWYFSRLDGPLATWITPDRLAEQQRLLPGLAYNRLWLNEWSSGLGDALTREDVEAAFREHLQPMRGHEPGWSFVAGVDLGLTRDASAVVVLAVPLHGTGGGSIRLAHHRVWQPVAGKKIDLLEVEKHIRELDDEYGLEFCAFDPWQMEHLAQRLETHSEHRRRNQRRRFSSQPWMREIPASAVNLRAIASLTIQCFTDHRLLLYPCEPLKRDLFKLRVEEKSYGYRLVSPRDEHGHGDTFSAFSLALLIAHELAGKRPTVLGALDQPKPLADWRHQQDAYRQLSQRQQNFLDAHPGYRSLLITSGRAPNLPY